MMSIDDILEGPFDLRRLRSGHRYYSSPIVDEVMHVLYPPALDPEIHQLKQTYGDRLHESYIDLLTESDGASLFTNFVQIFGAGQKMNRSTRIDERSSIPFFAKAIEFEHTSPKVWREGWCSIGSVSIVGRYPIYCHAEFGVTLSPHQAFGRKLIDVLEDICITISPHFMTLGQMRNLGEIDRAVAKLLIPK